MGERDAFFRAVEIAAQMEEEEFMEGIALLDEEQLMEEFYRSDQARQKALYLELQRRLAESLSRQAEAERRNAEEEARNEVLRAEKEAKESLAVTYARVVMEGSDSPQIHYEEEDTAAMALPSGTELEEVIRDFDQLS